MANPMNDMLISMVSKCPVLSAPTDWKETEESHIFITDLPGLTKQDVHVQLVDGGKVLQISGDRNKGDGYDHDNNHKYKWHHIERCRGKFMRRFRLPDNAITDHVKASMDNGLLFVTVPKHQINKSQKKVVQIQGN